MHELNVTFDLFTVLFITFVVACPPVYYLVALLFILCSLLYCSVLKDEIIYLFVLLVLHVILFGDHYVPCLRWKYFSIVIAPTAKVLLVMLDKRVMTFFIRLFLYYIAVKGFVWSSNSTFFWSDLLYVCIQCVLSVKFPVE